MWATWRLTFSLFFSLLGAWIFLDVVARQIRHQRMLLESEKQQQLEAEHREALMPVATATVVPVRPREAG